MLDQMKANLAKLQAELDEKENSISDLRQGVERLGNAVAVMEGRSPIGGRARGKRSMSEEGRRRIQEAQKRRWAEHRAEEAGKAKAASAKAASKGNH